jgi:hypothetical protein
MKKLCIYKGFISYTVFCFGIQKDSRPQGTPSYQFPIATVPQVPFKTHFQDPRPHGMVKMLPIPSLKKVKITKTENSNKEIAPRQSVPEEISSESRRHDAPLQKRSWSSSNCYLCCVTFCPEDPKKEIEDPLALY